MTPHSQLRQLSFGNLNVRSFVSLPQALSEQFADPTYAHATLCDADWDAGVLALLRT